MSLQDTWNGELPFGGQAKQVALCQDAQNHLELYYIGTGGRLYQNTQMPYGKEINLIDVAGVCWHFVA